MINMNNRTPPKPRVRYELVLVTPSMAAQILGRGDPNRNRCEPREAMFASDMMAGLWRATNQGIAFGGQTIDSDLLDGQTRLRAVVRANVNVWMMFAFGVEDIATIDKVRARTWFDNQIIKDKQNGNDAAQHNYRQLSAWIKAVDFLFWNSHRGFTDAEFDRRLSRFLLDIQWAHGLLMSSRYKYAPVAGAFVIAHGVYPESAQYIAEKLLGPTNLSVGDPAYALVRSINSGSGALGSGTESSSKRRDLILRILRAVRGHSQGERIMLLKPSEYEVGHFAAALGGDGEIIPTADQLRARELARQARERGQRELTDK